MKTILSVALVAGAALAGWYGPEVAPRVGAYVVNQVASEARSVWAFVVYDPERAYLSCARQHGMLDRRCRYHARAWSARDGDVSREAIRKLNPEIVIRATPDEATITIDGRPVELIDESIN